MGETSRRGDQLPLVKVALYSAIYGRYDRLKKLPDIGIPAYLYTDSNENLDGFGWEVRRVPHYIATTRGAPSITAPMLAHKWWKTHPELACPTVDISLWIDGSMEITVEKFVDRCLQALGPDDWACVPHPARNCIYPEGWFSATLAWKYDPNSILRQIRHYESFHPSNWGLIATGANVRRHTPEVIKLCHQWWDECLNWSHQDQLSLPVLLRLAGDKVKWNMNLPWFQWWFLHEHGG